MPEWWTYTLSDFLLFSPRSYYRMLERYHETAWPGQILGIGLGLLVLLLLRRPAERQGRTIWAIVALLWAWVAWAFLWERYSTINWAAVHLAGGFAVQVLLVAAVGVLGGRLTLTVGRDAAGLLGLGLLGLSLFVYPLIAPLAGRPWIQSEVFGMAPDPTVVGTLGLLVLVGGRARLALMAVPVLWCLISGATLLAMGSPEFWVPPMAAALALTGAVVARRPLSTAAAHPPPTASSSSSSSSCCRRSSSQ